MSKSPFSMGYRMPAEWERHEGTWLTWPKNLETFSTVQIEAVRRSFTEMIVELCEGERVDLLVDDERMEKSAASSVGSNSNLVFHRIRSADVWIRDYGPIFVKNRSVAATKWVFNSWGGKYDDLRPDDETGLAVARQTGLKVFEAGAVLEGGSVDVNGRGTLLTTKQCLLNKNRNPGLSATQIEGLLRDYLGATKVIWLDSGIVGDDTDGHIDDVARFVTKDTVVCMAESDRGDANHAPLADNLELLRRAKTADGRRLNVVPLEMPDPVDSEYGRHPASYANFYVANSVVLVPTFDSPNDEKALVALERLFPSRKVVGVDCRALVRGLGTVHCVTQQQPAGR
ncbi:MAG: agmatine deiminase family protein [Nitrososphaerales archaeon]|nr:agmatine deiminase family protein [Nitrososphaerales archaeon]